MKKLFFFISVFTLFLCGSIAVSAKISPAIDIIANESTMVKSSVLVNGEIIFDVDDFDLPIGANVSSIKITELPANSSGKLMLENLYVVENQVISRKDFSLLKFVNTSGGERASFKFKPNNQGYEIECELVSLSKVNLKPSGGNGATIEASTMRNIACFGTLLGYDPEGDNLTFEVISYPKKALLTITNANSGDYIYTPYENARGKDTFTYRVRDEFGNYSSECTVEIKIDKHKSSLAFSDVDKMDLGAAITVCENGIMEPTVNADGTLSFNPNEEITREEFVYLIMRTMGAKEVPTVEKTRFADDKDISPKYKGYLESAFALGIIKGETKSDGVYICPKRSITLAEAAVIINNIICKNSTTCMTVFADDEEIPSWARGAIESLTEAGIIKKTEGKISPNSPLTKAQVAQIIMALLKTRSK